MRKTNFWLPLFVFSILMGQTSIKKVGEPIELPGTSGFLAPQWSPAGETVAVTKINFTGLYVYNLTTTEVTIITEEEASGFGFRWSHSGNSLVFKPARYQDNKRYNSIKIYNSQTKKIRTVAANKMKLGGMLKWSIDDKAVFLTGNDTPYLVELSSRELAVQDIIFSIEKDVIKLQYPEIYDKIIYSADGPILNLEVSPNGNSLAFEVYGGNLLVYNRNSGTTIDLGKGNRPMWSPDGARVAFMISEDDGHQIVSADIIVVNQDGSGRVNLTDNFTPNALRPSWSPDGRFIIFDTDGAGPLYRLEVQ